MKRELNEASYAPFINVAEEIFASTMDSIFSVEVSISTSEVYGADADDLMTDFEDQTVILVTEENSGNEAGLFFKTKDITAMASMMMMMDPEEKDELTEDDVDAIKELCSQVLAALTIPVEEQTSVKVSFKIDDVIKNENSALFQSPGYLAADFSLGLGDKNTAFRFFMDEEMLTSFDGTGGGMGDFDFGGDMPDLGDAFNFGDDDGGGMDFGGGGGEMDFGSTTMDFGGGGGSEPTGNIGNLEILKDIDVPVSVKMGSTKMFLKDIISMGPGNIIELAESADEAVELTVNNKVIARGEVVIVDGYFGFRIKEIVSKAERLKKLKD